MMKCITYFIIFTCFIGLIFSCKSVEKLCFKSSSNWDYKIDRLLDTTQLYLKTELVSKVQDTGDLFLKNEKQRIKKSKPAIKFYENGKFEYFTQTDNTNQNYKVIQGEYRIYNDTIKICREYWSAQAGKYYDSELLIINSQGILQTVSEDIIFIFKKSEKQ